MVALQLLLVFCRGRISYPYTTLYFRDLGFSGLQVGILAALPSLFVAVCGPLWGSTADARGAHRFVLRTAQVLAALTVLVIA